MSDDVGNAIRDVLIDVARRRETITYAALLDTLDADDRHAAGNDLAPVLRSISVNEDAAGRGLLTAVVVRETDGLPGPGWFRLAAERGRDLADRTSAWQREVDAVFAAWA